MHKQFKNQYIMYSNEEQIEILRETKKQLVRVKYGLCGGRLVIINQGLRL